MKPSVSVVIPCYNAEEFIEECVLSVLRQDYSPIEIIVVDDASTDNSVSKIAEYPICISRNTINAGECKTSARGFSMASGKYICRLSADDTFVNNNHISRQVEEMERYNLDWCYNSKSLVGNTIESSIETQTSWIPIPIRHSAIFFNVFDNFMLSLTNVCYLIAITRNPINSSALMIRADMYYKSLTWDSSLRTRCDGSLIGKMFLRGLKARAIPEVGAFYRIHSNQATGKQEANRDLVFMRERLCNEIKNNNHPLWMKLIVRCLHG